MAANTGVRQRKETGERGTPVSYTVLNLNSDFQKQANMSHIKEIKSTKLGGEVILK